MAEAFLFATVCVLLLFVGWLEWLHVRERRTLVNTLIARTPSEVRMLNQQVDRPEPPIESRLTPEEREFWDHGEMIGL